jgi:outer membrane lipoprotein SlyB
MRRLILLAITLLSTSCATYRPVVDIRDRQEAYEYERDLRDCQRYARSVDPAGSAIVGALVGAVVGAAFGAAVGDRSVALDVARVGAIEGGVAGAADGAGTQVDIIRNCLVERGYRVLH